MWETLFFGKNFFDGIRLPRLVLRLKLIYRTRHSWLLYSICWNHDYYWLTMIHVYQDNLVKVFFWLRNVCKKRMWEKQKVCARDTVRMSSVRQRLHAIQLVWVFVVCISTVTYYYWYVEVSACTSMYIYICMYFQYDHAISPKSRWEWTKHFPEGSGWGLEQNFRCSPRICGKTTGKIEHPEAAAKFQTNLVLEICL